MELQNGPISSKYKYMFINKYVFVNTEIIICTSISDVVVTFERGRKYVRLIKTGTKKKKKWLFFILKKKNGHQNSYIIYRHTPVLLYIGSCVPNGRGKYRKKHLDALIEIGKV